MFGRREDGANPRDNPWRMSPTRTKRPHLTEVVRRVCSGDRPGERHSCRIWGFAAPHRRPAGRPGGADRAGPTLTCNTVTLLPFLGCTANSHEVAQLMGDEIRLLPVGAD